MRDARRIQLSYTKSLKYIIQTVLKNQKVLGLIASGRVGKIIEIFQKKILMKNIYLLFY